MLGLARKLRFDEHEPECRAEWLCTGTRGFNLQTATQYWWRAKNVDSSNASSSFSATRAFTVDTTAPSVSASAVPGTGAGYQYYDGAVNTLWLNADQAGDFSLAASASDPESGIASVGFPAIFGTSANNDPSNPYQSATYSFDGTGTPFGSPGAVTVTAANGVTVPAPSTSSDQVTISADGTAPAAFALGGPADTAKVGTGITVSAAPTDAGSGLRQVAFLYCDASGGPCVPSIQIGSAQTVPAAGIYAVDWDTTGLTDGHAYAVEAIATDNVGHTRASTINTVTVDNSAPNVSVAAPLAVTGNAFQWYDAAGKKLWLNDHQSGSFKLRVNASDPDSGISSVTFPALLGLVQPRRPQRRHLRLDDDVFVQFAGGTGRKDDQCRQRRQASLLLRRTATPLTSRSTAHRLRRTPTFPLNNGSYASWHLEPRTAPPFGPLWNRD